MFEGSRLRCEFGRPCDNWCLGKREGNCGFPRPSVLDQLAKELERSHAQDAQDLNSAESRKEKVWSLRKLLRRAFSRRATS